MKNFQTLPFSHLSKCQFALHGDSFLLKFDNLDLTQQNEDSKVAHHVRRQRPMLKPMRNHSRFRAALGQKNTPSLMVSPGARETSVQKVEVEVDKFFLDLS